MKKHATKTKTLLSAAFAGALLTLSGCDLSPQCEASHGNWCEAIGGPAQLKAEPKASQPQGAEEPNGRTQAEPEHERGAIGGKKGGCIFRNC